MTCPKSSWSGSKSHVKALFWKVYYKGYNYGWTSQWLRDKESACQCRSCRRLGFNPWVRKSPRRRKWQSTQILLPGKSHGQRSLVGYSPWGRKSETQLSTHIKLWPVVGEIRKGLKVKLLSCVRLFATPWTVAHQASQSMEFSRQEYWSGLPFPSPGDLPNPGIEPRSPTLQVDALPSEPPGKPMERLTYSQICLTTRNIPQKLVSPPTTHTPCPDVCFVFIR